MTSIDMAQATVVLFGLDDALAAELESVLTGHIQAVHSQPFRSPDECLRVVSDLGAELVFCSADRERYLGLLEAVERDKPDLPIVVVSRHPEVSEWLDAIEAGASDYCASPFETVHIRWILDSTLKHRPAPVLYRAAG